MTSRQSWQRCDDCGNEIDELDPAPRCPRCRGLLAIVHATPGASPVASPSGVWRFGPMVMPSGMAAAVSYPEGNTPLLARPAIAKWAGVPRLLLKHEGMNPTGSFKDRGMTVAMTQAKRIGARAVACASTGNTSASLAAYAALAGIPALALVPDGQVAMGKMAQTLAYGARTLLVDGDFDDCLRLIEAASTQLGVYLVNSINPYRLEGQKTIPLELFAQLGGRAPDWIALPAGNLGNTAAFGKAIEEALAAGMIDRRPRLAAIQAAGAAPFAAAFDRGFDALVPVQAETVATAIKIGAPASYARAVRAIQLTAGVVVTVSDAEILAAKVAIDRAGVGCEPASAASVAGVKKLRASGVIGPDDEVVAVLTGHVLKDPGILQSIHGEDSPLPELANRPIRIAAEVAEVARVLASGPMHRSDSVA